MVNNPTNFIASSLGLNLHKSIEKSAFIPI